MVKKCLLKQLEEKLSTNDILDDKKMQIALDELGLNNENDLYYEIGIGKYNPTQVIKTILNEKEDEKKILEKTLKYQSPIMDATGEIIIDGMSDLKVSFGGCCMPVKGDDIVGYISKGNGITIHRKNCHNIVDQDERIINASWNENINKKYVTNVLIYADKKDNLLLDIISKTSAMNIGVKSVNTISNVDYNVYDLNILVDDKQMLDRYISIIKQIPSVNDCVRGNK